MDEREAPRFADGRRILVRCRGVETLARAVDISGQGAQIEGPDLPGLFSSPLLCFPSAQPDRAIEVVSLVMREDGERRGVRLLEARFDGGLLDLCRFLEELGLGRAQQLAWAAERRHPRASSWHYDFLDRALVGHEGEGRRGDRRPLEGPRPVTLDDGRRNWSGTLVNIGPAGTFVTCEELPPIGTIVTVFADGRPGAAARTEVRWRESGRPSGLGLRFLDPRNALEVEADRRFSEWAGE